MRPLALPPDGARRLPRYAPWRDPGLRLTALLAVFVMGLLSLERLLLLALLSDRFQGLSWGDFGKAFLVGWRFDVSVTCALLLPLVALLAFVNTATMRWRATGHVIAVVCCALAGFVLIACIVDFAFFAEYDERLDYKVIYYTGSIHTARMLWTEYPMVSAVLAALAALYLLLRLFHRAYEGASASRPAARAVLWSLALLPLLCLGIRNTLGPKPMNSGTAHFSPSLLLAQLSLNGLFTLQEAIDSTLQDRDLAQFVELLPEDEALERAVRSIARPEDRLLGDVDNPLRRVTVTGRPRRDLNVVVLVLESHSWSFIGAMGGDARLSPNLDALIAEGILAEHCFAVGSRTPHGLSGTLCGFPDLPGESATTRPGAQRCFLTLGQVLAARDYETLFLYGGPATYDHMRSFVRSNGFERAIFDEDLEQRTFRTHLGWCDEDLYEQLHRELGRSRERPFLAVALTQSFHRPYQVPAGKVEPIDPAEPDAEVLTAARYADWALGRFFARAREADWFDDTLFVIVADHTGGARGTILSPASYRIPFVLYAPAILGREGRRIETVCSQTDVAPTVLSLLGGEYEHCFFGASILDRPPATGGALLQRNSKALAYMDADRNVVLVPFRGGETQLSRFSLPDRLEPLDASLPGNAALRDELERQGVALLQTAQRAFVRGAHTLSGGAPAP